MTSLHKACKVLGLTPSTLNRTKQSKIKRMQNQKGRLRSATKDGGRKTSCKGQRFRFGHKSERQQNTESGVPEHAGINMQNWESVTGSGVKRHR